MDEREFEGKDLEEALQTASSELGIAEQDLHYEMVEQGRRGLFGLGVKSVRIRIKPPVRPLPGADADPEPAGDEPREAQEAHEAREPKKRPRRRAKRVNEQPKQEDREQPRERSPVSVEQGREVEQTVQRIVDLMGLELEVGARSVDHGVTLELGGADRKLLTERNSELLQAMQLLVNRMSRRAWPGAGRIHLQCDGQDRRRDDEIVKLTREAAEQVSQTGRTKKLQPLNAYERRLVHLTVREFGGLTSSSDGQGSLKRVRISKVQNAIEQQSRA